MAFTKLFSSIITSTIWMEKTDTRIVWITMLALADKNGEVQGSVPGLARMAGVSVDACREALNSFLGPDPDSRTKDDEGRRIEEIDGGWFLLNHAKYRKMASKEEQIEKATARTRRYREAKARNGVSRDVYAESTHVHGNPTDAEAEANTEEEKKDKNAPSGASGNPKGNGTNRRSSGSRLPADWALTHERLEYGNERNLQDVPAVFLDFCQYWWNKPGKAGEKLDWDMAWQTWCRNQNRFGNTPQPTVRQKWNGAG